MTALNIGSTADAGDAVTLDLMTLVDTRLLVQANSGGGKSGTLRLIAERAASAIQTIVLDNEGEFGTLREQIDMLLVGDGGELPAHPSSAAKLARRLLESQVSAVIDLYELSLEQRRHYVANFLEALIALPRSLWRPTLVIIDESHLYCPQAGDVPSSRPVIGLMSQGRKRGFAGILATQRLSKLHKDAAAECNNVIIGRTTLDIDQRRAADILGFRSGNRDVFKSLVSREFFGFGPAFNLDNVFRMRTADVATTMPKAGHRFAITVPPPSSSIAAMLANDFDHMPDSEDPLTEARGEIARLRQQLQLATIGADASAVAESIRTAVDRDRSMIRQRLSDAAIHALSAIDDVALSLTRRTATDQILRDLDITAARVLQLVREAQ